ncbi:hypothetical protein [Aquabacterium sp.]|uniref:hypothetical protein n=1 Tax=Aquabacterium sp. TaxID=1872578 RepID=UPI002B887A8D|nr:hypothetical protein [Aquabacterium sp.]HSW06266.1 hypothetical protein [Aquabacterium sp.]
MIDTLRPLLAVLGLMMMAMGAAAQTAPGDSVYRCGPDGRSYSTTPCASGKPVEVADPRSAEQQRQARDAAQRERQMADKLIAERVQREKATVPAAAGHIGPPAKASAPKSTKPKKKKKGKAVDPTMSEPIRTVTPTK